jgi:diguanylate cyclase (GGDEF)-like protein
MLPKLFALALLLSALLGPGLADAARPLPPALTSSAAAVPLHEPRFDSIGVKQIPQGVVSALAQDRAGFLWVGTSAGLMRYDGYSLRLQGADDKGAGNQGLGFTRALLAARDGRLWIGTESDGLARYDPATERVSFLRAEMSSSSSAELASAVHRQAGPAPTVRALAEDSDGAIWVGSVGGGLDRYDPATGRFTHFRHSSAAGSLPDDRVQALLIDRSGALWVGSWAGLSRRAKGSKTFEPVFSGAAKTGAAPNLAGRIVLTLFEASDGRIWVGTQQGDLAVIAPAALGTNAKAAQMMPNTSAGAAGAIYSLAEPSKGQIWVGRASGIEVRDGQGDGRVEQWLRHDPRRPAGLAGDEVRALLVDRAGWLWVGGFGVGLQRHNVGKPSIGQRAEDVSPDSPLAESNVRSLLQLDNGEIWAGTNSEGVAVMDAQLRLIGSLRPGAMVADKRGATGHAGRAVRIGALTQSASGSVWVGVDSMLYEYSRDRRLLRSVPTAAGSTRRLLTGVDGTLWVGTQDGLYRLAPGAQAVMRVTRADGTSLTGDVNALVQAPDRSLWAGTEKGLFRLSADSLRPEPVPMHEAGTHNSMPPVVGLLIDSRQQLWVDAPVIGLYRLKDLAQPSKGFERVNVQRATQGRAFGANLLEDGRGRIWTHQFVYEPRDDSTDELTAADGADFGTGWFRAYTKTSDGRLLFGGSRGLLVINPAQFDRWSYAPPLVISALRVDGQPQAVGDLQAGSAPGGLPNKPQADKAVLTLDPVRRGFSLEFAALDFSDPSRCRYAYRLDGVDSEWIDTGADFRVASYSNLSPGDYTLRVRATNRSGVWSPHELAVPVRVLPAWWQSAWFRVAGVLGLIGLYFVLLQLRTRLLRRSQRRLEAKVRERTRELESLGQALEQSSLTDPLTGLRNRRFLTQHIDGDVALTLRHYDSLCQRGEALPDDADLIFFLIDIDHFKGLNDTHGHAAGDAVLMQMRGRLQPVFREADHLVRWGGEEFLIVARATSRQHAAELAERARTMVADTPFKLPGGRTVRSTCSVGFACFPLATAQPRAVDWSATIALADSALFAAKAAGRNGWMGVQGVQGGGADLDAEALQALAPRTLAQWADIAPLDVVASQDRD